MSDEQVNALNAEATEQAAHAAQAAQDTASAAPNAGETASPAEAPVSGENATPGSEAPEQPKPAKTFSQEEVDALIAKRLAREERKRQREMQQMHRPAEQPQAEAPAAPAGKPDPTTFQTTEAYLEALTDWKAEKKARQVYQEHELAAREERARAHIGRIESEYRQRESLAMDKYPDFEEKVYGVDAMGDALTPISDHVALAIKHSEIGPDIAYYLAENRPLAAKIYNMHPLMQAKEIGKLEAKLASAPAPAAPATPTAAPAPITPVGGKQTAAKIFDTTDPRSIKSMSTSEWIAAERKRQEAKWNAQHR